MTPPHTTQTKILLSNGNKLNFIESFLTDRTFSVKVNGHLSQKFQQENGVPQGSTLSVTLFLIAINSITEDIKFPVKYSLFADDFNFFCSGTNMLSTQISLQETINSLSDWSFKTGFTFSAEKSQCIFFTRKKKLPVDIILKIGDAVIQNKKSPKILGVIFDTKNTWTHHIKTLRKESLLRINILNSIAHSSWGAHSKPLLQIYKALIFSKIKYGSFLFHNAKHKNLQMIDSVYNTGLRISIGAFKSSPWSSIHNIAGIPSLHICRLQNDISIVTKRASNKLKIMENIKNILKKSNFSLAGIINREHSLVVPSLG